MPEGAKSWTAELSPTEIQGAEDFVLRITQKENFSEEIATL
jgi:hypothetical protein